MIEVEQSQAKSIVPQAAKTPTEQEPVDAADNKSAMNKSYSEDATSTDVDADTSTSSEGPLAPKNTPNIPGPQVDGSTDLKAVNHMLRDAHIADKNKSLRDETEKQAATLQTLCDLSKFSADFSQVDGSSAYELPEPDVSGASLQANKTSTQSTLRSTLIDPGSNMAK